MVIEKKLKTRASFNAQSKNHQHLVRFVPLLKAPGFSQSKQTEKLLSAAAKECFQNDKLVFNLIWFGYRKY